MVIIEAKLQNLAKMQKTKNIFFLIDNAYDNFQFPKNIASKSQGLNRSIAEKSKFKYCGVSEQKIQIGTLIGQSFLM